MKNIYDVWIRQTVTSYKKLFTFSKNKKQKEEIGYCKGNNQIILADDEEEAIEIYKQRYTYDFDYVIDRFYLWDIEYQHIENITNEVCVKQQMYSFDDLKDKMRADDFIEYCKQQLYPINDIIQYKA